MTPPTRPAFSVATQLIEEAGRQFGIDPVTLFRRGRFRDQAHPRFAVIWALRQFAPPDKRRHAYSYPRLARLLGFDDHKSVMHGYHRAVAMRDQDPNFRRITNELVTYAMTLGPQATRNAA